MLRGLVRRTPLLFTDPEPMVASVKPDELPLRFVSGPVIAISKKRKKKKEKKNEKIEENFFLKEQIRICTREAAQEVFSWLDA